MDGAGLILRERRIDKRVLKSLHAATYRCAYERIWSDIFVSDEIEDITGWTADEFLRGELEFLDLFLETEREAIKKSYQDQVARRGQFSVKAKIETRDGRIRWIKDTGVRTTDDTGRAVIDGLIMDVTNQRSIEMDRDRAQRRAKSYASFAERALDVIAHEIRTPLNAVYGYSQLLQAGASAYPPDVLEEYVANILEASHQLKGLSDSALKSLEIRTDSAPAHEPFALINVVKTVRKQFKKNYKNSSFFCDEAALSHCVALGSPEHFEQIIEDLFHNSVKHNPGGVNVEVSAHRLHDDGLAICIDDDGCGVPDENLRDIFGAFLKVRSTENLSCRGFGLGLNRVIVAAHALKAEVYTRRSPRGGLRVVIALPSDRVMEAPDEAPTFELCCHFRVS